MKYMPHRQKIYAKNLRIKDNVLLLQHTKKATTVDQMIITAVQTDIVWNEPTVNQNDAERLMASAPHSDVYVLPEMWATGFATEPQGMAEDEQTCSESGSLAWMKRMAAETDAAICGSLSIRTAEGEYANRMYFVRPDGSFDFYDKRHLFGCGGEDRFYTPGKRRVVVEFRGVRFLLLVCYDLRFPVWSRNNDDYDAIILAANWPTPRQEVWTTLLRARALENQCCVVGVNRVGKDPMCPYNGGSIIVNSYGKTVADAGQTASAATAEIDFEKQNSFRRSFPVLKDRESFSIEKL